MSIGWIGQASATAIALSLRPSQALHTACLASAIAYGLAISACDPPTQAVDPVDPMCEGGNERRCTTDDGCAGIQRCAPIARRWQACQCIPSTIGAPCSTDDDCGAIEQCLSTTASYLGGSPSSGTCSVRCDREPGLCSRLEPPSVCVVTDDRGTGERDDDRAHCLERCSVGDGDPDKCHGRADVACEAPTPRPVADATSAPSGAQPVAPHVPVLEPAEGSDAGEAMNTEASQAGVCRPLCTKDSECATGLCDPRTGACASSARGGKGLGAACDPSAESSECQGICVQIDDAAYCSNRCTLGGADDCAGAGVSHNDGRALLPGRGLCRFAEEASGGIGDVGFCTLACDCSDECQHPELACAGFGDTVLSALVEHAGLCTPRPEMDRNGITPELLCTAPDAGAAP